MHWCEANQQEQALYPVGSDGLERRALSLFVVPNLNVTGLECASWAHPFETLLAGCRHMVPMQQVEGTQSHCTVIVPRMRTDAASAGACTCTDTRNLTLLHGFWCNLVHHSAYLSVVPRIIVRLQGPSQSGLVRFLKLWILERLLPADVSVRESRPWYT
jgi:hypothetical protein